VIEYDGKSLSNQFEPISHVVVFTDPFIGDDWDVSDVIDSLFPARFLSLSTFHCRRALVWKRKPSTGHFSDFLLFKLVADFLNFFTSITSTNWLFH